jgi:hypothetical protein
MHEGMPRDASMPSLFDQLQQIAMGVRSYQSLPSPLSLPCTFPLTLLIQCTPRPASLSHSLSHSVMFSCTHAQRHQVLALHSHAISRAYRFCPFTIFV